MQISTYNIINKTRDIISSLSRRLIIDIGNCYDSIFISGSARSGTTWLQEIINFDNEYRIMFEPFHPKKVECINDWKYFQYIRVNDESEKYLIPMEKILRGKLRNSWVDRLNKKHFTKTRILKAIHANLFLFWMKNHFPKIPIILIIRHPCAVANSKINIASDFFRNTINPLERFLTQRELMEDFLSPFESDIREAKTNFETYIFMWCIENFVPLKLFQPGEIHVTFYENLCIKPEDEVKKIFSFLGKSFSPNIMNQIIQPSVMSKKGSAVNTGDDLISSWRNYINQEEIVRAVEILNLFDLDILYNNHDLPISNNEEVLKLFNYVSK